MSHLPIDRARTVSPGIKQVAFDDKCQVIPEGDCAELRKLLSLCPTRAQSPPIVGHSRSSSLIARAISPQLGRAKSPNFNKKATGLGNAPPSSTSTSWRTRLASWGSNTASASNTSTSSSSGHRRTQSHNIDANISAAFAFPPQASSSSHNKDNSNSSTLSNNDGPRLVAPIAARGTPNLIIPSSDDDSVEISPSNESIISFDDVDAEFQHAVSRVAMPQLPTPFGTIHPTPSPTLQPPRSTSPYVARSVSELQHRPPMPKTRPKSCLVRSRTPQAPGPPRLMGDGMTPLRATRSHDRVGCFTPRRRADGVPVICASSPLESPLESPQEEQGPIAWGQNAQTSKQASAAAAPPPPAPDKSKLSRWRRFRRFASEDSQRYEPSSPVGPPSETRLDDASIKRQIQAGRWPFEAPLNVECSCKNCQAKIEVGLASNYEPRWTRAARIRWLEGQEDAALQSADKNSSAASTNATVTRSTSRTAIQADEVAQLHNETVHPMTADELAQEPASPQVERGDPLSCAARSPTATGLEEGDDLLRKEIMARRQKAARQSPVMRHGARSMLRQIEEAERREQEAARVRTASRESHRESGSRPGSGFCSPASPASPGLSPSTPTLGVSTSTCTQPQETQAASPSSPSSSSYFEFSREPPQRVRSPLIPADVAFKPRYGEDADAMTLSMASVAQTLEALASPEASPVSE